MEYNIYCDESCHLEHDKSNSMSIGAIYCRKDKLKEINNNIIRIKEKNGITKFSEVKWTKISPANKRLYMDLIDYFFHDDDLSFRCVIVPNKHILDHKAYHQTHDDWYYKMYFTMLKTILSPTDCHNIYIDIKDTNSYEKSQRLLEITRNSQYDYNSNIVRKIQPIRSHEVQIMQLVDIFVGAMTYANRIFPDNENIGSTKQELCDYIRKISGYSLQKSTLAREEKINLLVWEANYYAR
ncbi:DUF3800 domain-containing protein [Clostridium sp. C1]|uniref:DUF3800 domain-containing protein n=1 Tax=Clostridium sp. C1 TaxID=1155388 RepID=UPI001BAC942A|nr:DUF3800 domain-containing protein [Clostridium sp. C1]MEE0777505.1 DUF3800 domain-containing protein [Massilimicrobiota sp.]QUN13639.1 DUF3800 domain-containing protein [Clostridium sp. C1]